MERIAKLLPVEDVSVSPADLPGKYTSHPEELTRRAGPPLSGSELYLFPGGSYIYVEWADIYPRTIHDRGKWSVQDGRLHLESNEVVTWVSRRSRDLLAVRRATHSNEVMLVETERELPNFEQNAAKPGEDREFWLLLSSHSKVTPITAAEEQSLKLRLLSESWRPEAFRDYSSRF